MFSRRSELVANGSAEEEALRRASGGPAPAAAGYCPPAVWRRDGALTAHDGAGWRWGTMLLIPSSNFHRR